NNIGSNWQEAFSTYGAGDKGTPGALNDSCNGIVCEANEISRMCVSDGNTEVTYEWNNPTCGNNYTEIESDSSRVCIETEIAGECVDEFFRNFTFTYNYDYCEVREPEDREDETCSTPDPYCGDGQCNGGETCSSCPRDCGTCGGGGGGGGGGVTSLYIHTEIAEKDGATAPETISVVITWHTNKPATSRVVYGLSPVDPLGPWPNLGYPNSTIEDLEKVTFHTVIIDGLLANTQYYFRPVSAASPPVYGEELSITTEQKDTPPEEEEDPPAGGEEEEEEITPDQDEEEEPKQEEEPAKEPVKQADTGIIGSGAQVAEGDVLGESNTHLALSDGVDEDAVKDEEPKDEDGIVKGDSLPCYTDECPTSTDSTCKCWSDWWWLIIILLLIIAYLAYENYRIRGDKETDQPEQGKQDDIFKQN
ncbi:fibronectin type III domain-containing protein, partial [bacterium]|nr:fibronectin type III domain-containing protein [bacterium]